ncbi:MAG: hypothetical protein KC457_15945, partial [Myxococcales bacterium]|nr:hypothetical protein [Myxococcales bacterium]
MLFAEETNGGEASVTNARVEPPRYDEVESAVSVDVQGFDAADTGARGHLCLDDGFGKDDLDQAGEDCRHRVAESISVEVTDTVAIRVQRLRRS